MGDLLVIVVKILWCDFLVVGVDGDYIISVVGLCMLC